MGEPGLRFGTTHARSGIYTDDYVRVLRRQFGGFGRPLTVLGNGEDYDAPLQRFDGRWSKLEWFAPWNAALRPAVVFDLDTFIIADPAPFLRLDPQHLWLIKEFLGPPGRQKAESGIFVVPADEVRCRQIWEAAQQRDPRDMDGHLLRKFPHCMIPDEIDGIYSYKGHHLAQAAAPPANAVAVCFHGRPKQPDTTGWALELWKNSLR